MHRSYVFAAGHNEAAVEPSHTKSRTSSSSRTTATARNCLAISGLAFLPWAEIEPEKLRVTQGTSDVPRSRARSSARDQDLREGSVSEALLLDDVELKVLIEVREWAAARTDRNRDRR